MFHHISPHSWLLSLPCKTWLDEIAAARHRLTVSPEPGLVASWWVMMVGPWKAAGNDFHFSNLEDTYFQCKDRSIAMVVMVK